MLQLEQYDSIVPLHKKSGTCNAKYVFSQQTQFQNYLGFLKFYIGFKTIQLSQHTICCSFKKQRLLYECTDVLNKSSKLDLTQTEMDADSSYRQEYKCIRVSLRNQYLTGSQLAASLKSTCQATVSSGMKPLLSFKEKDTSGTGE